MGERFRPRSAAADRGEVLIYGAIVPHDWLEYEPGGTSAQSFRAAMEAAREAGGGAPPTVRLNCPGGDVWEASAMQVVLAEMRAPVIVDGLAASAAAFLALSGASLAMAPLSMMMLHQAHACACGPAADLRTTADTLDDITRRMCAFAAPRMQTDEASLLERLTSADEIWISADEAVAEGIADRLLGGGGDTTPPAPPAAAVTARTIRLAQYQAT